MATEKFDSEAAVEALKSALQSNEELVNKFKDANEKVQMAFTSSGDALGGALGNVAGNAWITGSGESFESRVMKATEEFLNYKVNDIINEMQTFTDTVTQTYGGN